MSKLSFSFYPNIGKTSIKTRRIPIYLRVIFKGKKAEQRLNVEILENQMRSWNCLLMRLEINNSTVNQHLDSISNQFARFLAINETELGNYTVRKILDTVLLKLQPGQNQLLKDFALEFYEKAIAQKKSLSNGTKRNYLQALMHLETFLKIEKKEMMLLKDFDYNFANDFKNYLLNDNSKIGKKGMTQPSALCIIKKLRTIFEEAYDKELVGRNYFKKIKLSGQSPRKPRLSIHQVYDLMYSDHLLTKSETIVRDLFVFKIFTGLSYTDVKHFNSDSLEIKNSDLIKLQVRRAKTGQSVEQFINTFVIQLIEKYKNDVSLSGSKRVIPHRSNAEQNRILKEIARKTNISIRVTVHTARHTFRQLLSEAGIEDIGVIKRMMGHSRGSEIDDVYYEITESRLLAAKIKFEEFLKNNLEKVK